MLSLVDIKGMCDCTEEEIEAIAMHEHLPDAVACEMADYLINCPDGIPRIRIMIRDDIDYAMRAGDSEQVEKLKQVLMHFIANHPENQQRLSV